MITRFAFVKPWSSLLVVFLFAEFFEAGASAASEPGDASSRWDAFVHQFIEEHLRANPDFAVNEGRHEFDGQLPDWSRKGIEQEAQRLKTASERARQFDASRLDAARQFERRYLLASIDGQLFWLDTAKSPFKNPLFYINSLDPSVYLTRPYAPLPVRMRAFIQFERNLPHALTQIRANLAGPSPKTFSQLGQKVFGGLADFFRNDVPKVFSPVQDSELQSQFPKANAPAAAACMKLAEWFEQKAGHENGEYALRRDRFAEMIRRTEGVTTPLDGLQKIGRADLERNLAALKAACAQLHPDKTIQECVAEVQAEKPKEGPVQAARRQLTELRQFVTDHDLVTIPGPEQAEVEEAPPYNRWNAAYIEIPGPYDTNLPSVYRIAPPDPSWSRQEQADYIPAEDDLLFTSVHEVWPGHFLQFLHANRSRSKFGQLFVGYAFAEGWAHYTEEMMWEAGLGKGDPKVHIGQLLNALLRDVRFLSAIGLHSGTMTVEESEQMFREKAFQDPGNARQQAARGTFDPAYLNYTMGKLMIRKLRSDWTRSRGGRAAWKAFHDQLLSYGGPPIPLVRRAMLAGSNVDPSELF